MAHVALGIDLAWTDGKTSGLCFMERTPHGWEVKEAIAETWSNDEIVDWVLGRSAGTTVVAIDAPLCIPNPMGTRECDRTVASEYWKYLIGVYPCNKSLFKNRPRCEDIRRRLMDRVSFVEVPVRSDRVFFETYPHPAIVNVLRLDRRVAYKKGRVRDRRRKLAWLGRKLLAELPIRNPRVLDTAALSDALGGDLEPLRGKALKAAEDAIDAVVCAYCAASWLDLGAPGNEVIGKLEHGMMIFPKREQSID